MMGSSPVGEEDQVYSLLKLISDPAGAKDRLDALAKQAADNADTYKKQKQEVAEAVAKAKALQAKADADAEQASSNLARATNLLSGNQAREVELNQWAAKLRDEADKLASREASMVSNTNNLMGGLTDREHALALREKDMQAAEIRVQKAETAAVELKAALEKKLAAFKALAD